jgi:hypothetical protein
MGCPVMALRKSHSDIIFLIMRTKQELLEFVDRIVGVDKMEAQSQFALIELEPASGKQDEIANADEDKSADGHGI